MSQVEGSAPDPPFHKVNLLLSLSLLSWEEKHSGQAPLWAQGFVESCEIMYTEIQGRWGLRMEGRGGYGVNEAGGVEARGSRGAKICSQASRQHNEPVLALYKVMSSKHVGVGHVHRFILIHWWSCQLRGRGCGACQLIPRPLSHTGQDFLVDKH